MSQSQYLRKRKERESATLGAEPVAPNRLLAGYMAYEFLTKGTLFGQKWDPARAEAQPVLSNRIKPGGLSHGVEAEPSRKVVKQQQQQKHYQGYDEVASLLKGNGAHVPGIVNPTQLTRWIQM